MCVCVCVCACVCRRLEEEKRCWQGEMDELLGKMAALQTERKALVRIKTELDANTKSLEAELELARHAHRCSHQQANHIFCF